VTDSPHWIKYYLFAVPSLFCFDDNIVYLLFVMASPTYGEDTPYPILLGNGSRLMQWICTFKVCYYDRQ